MFFAYLERLIHSNERYNIFSRLLKRNHFIDDLAQNIIDYKNTELFAKSIEKFRLAPYFLKKEERLLLYSFLFNDEKIKAESMEEFRLRLLSFSLKHLRIIEEILISSGKLQNALFVFNCIIEKTNSFGCKKHKPFSNLDYLWSCFYREIDLNKTNLDVVSNPFVFSYNRSLFDSLKSIICDRNICSNIIDSKFQKMINNKKIVVLGPAPLPIEETIFDCDVLVVINFKGTENYTHYLSKIPVVIAYYNYEAEIFLNNCVDKNLKEIDYFCFKKIRYDFQRKIKKEDIGREYLSIDNLLLCGQPYIIQNIIFDLLCCSPASIKLLCFSLYASNNLYNNGYINVGTASSKKLRAFAKHNIINQFFFLQSLLKCGVISFDTFGNDLMKRGIVPYLEMIDYYFVPKEVVKK